MSRLVRTGRQCFEFVCLEQFSECGNGGDGGEGVDRKGEDEDRDDGRSADLSQAETTTIRMIVVKGMMIEICDGQA